MHLKYKSIYQIWLKFCVQDLSGKYGASIYTQATYGVGICSRLHNVHKCKGSRKDWNITVFNTVSTYTGSSLEQYCQNQFSKFKSIQKYNKVIFCHIGL